MYYEQQMRRFLSIAVMMLLALSPLAAAVPGSGEPQVAACCRRNGVHHCAMMEISGTQSAHSNETALQRPSHCPLYPDGMKANVVSHHAMASQAAGFGSLLVQTHSAACSRAAARVSQMRTRAVRGPPAALQL